MFAPVAGTGEVCRRVWVVKAFGDLVDAEIVGRAGLCLIIPIHIIDSEAMRQGLDYSLFSRPADRSRVLARDEPMIEPILQRAPPFLGRVRTAVAGVVVRLGRHLRVLQ